MGNEARDLILKYIAEPVAGLAEEGEKLATKTVKTSASKPAGQTPSATPEATQSEAPAASAAIPTVTDDSVDTDALPADAANAPTVITTEPIPKEAEAPRTIMDAVKSITVPSLPSLSAMPTPGGIGLLLFMILLILFAFQSAGENGETRLQLLWNVIRGNASLAGETNASDPNAPNTSAPVPGGYLTNSGGIQYSGPGGTTTIPSGQVGSLYIGR